VVDPLAAAAAKVQFFAVLLFGDHHRFVELQMAVGTGDSGQDDAPGMG
jgi:hypothetical protein